MVTAYSTGMSTNCESVKNTIKCGNDGTFGTGAAYTYSYCMPWDGTSTWLINSYHP
jgi:hypothetical protein